MDTPLCRFLSQYADSDPLRLHMPGHKGQGSDAAQLDITEIDGADSLYEADGILAESERNAGHLFGCHTFYSTEGSSLSIRAMLYLATLYAKSKGQTPRIVAGRNAHKVFLSAAALLDFRITWLAPKGSSYLSCPITAEDVKTALSANDRPTAVYLTSPDYLGNTVDVAAIARICREQGVLLLVDNAHGAYLKFLSPSRHPMDLGADLCCDSAHKTLPALTGSAYLHIASTAPAFFAAHAKQALSLFGSTSPSYLILNSLDALNPHLATNFRQELASGVSNLHHLANHLLAHGFSLIGNEPMKLTIAPKSYGYTGRELASYLLSQNIIPEFYDPDYLTLMPSPCTSRQELEILRDALTALPRRQAIVDLPPTFHWPRAIMTPREAILSPAEYLPVEACIGRIVASVTVGCPPAIPIVVSGERLEQEHISAFTYYGIKTCSVVKKA